MGNDILKIAEQEVIRKKEEAEKNGDQNTANVKTGGETGNGTQDEGNQSLAIQISEIDGEVYVATSRTPERSEWMKIMGMLSGAQFKFQQYMVIKKAEEFKKEKDLRDKLTAKSGTIFDPIVNKLKKIGKI